MEGMSGEEDEHPASSNAVCHMSVEVSMAVVDAEVRRT